MNTESELSKFKLYYEDIREASYWRALIKRTALQIAREHIKKPLASIALTMPAMMRTKRK